MALDTAIDMGRDGGGTITARDAYGFQLNYFTGDYKPVNTVRNPFPGHSAYIGAAYRPLYNGNISSMGVNIGQLNQPQLYNYEYDQLNRLVSMQAYRNFDQPGNSWSGISATTDHQEAITYDGNGNITAYLRNGNTSAGKPLAMDNLGYHYNKDGNGNLLNNRLRHVTDAVTATANYTEDIDGQVDSSNYHYDQIGNLTGDVSEQIDSIEWNVYGKISRIWKSVTAATGALQQIAYSYDPSGNRISKTVYSNQDASNYKAVNTWYVRDASGNVMATYTSEDVAAKSTLATGTLGKLYLSELHMYGSSRLGIWSRKVDMDVVPTSGGTAPLLGSTGIDTFNRGNKFFELANHLGNVLVTVSDRKIGQNPVNGLYSSYTAEVVSASDYAPFGMQMVGRTFSAGSYRYGFNGKENDKETTSTTTYDYGFRIYSPALGRFLSIDPLAKSFPWYTPYQYAGNKPINSIDVDGLEDHNVVTNEVDNSLTSTGADHKTAKNPIAYGRNITPWKDLLNFKVSTALWEKTQSRIGNILPPSIQTIEEGNSTNTNFDYYSVKITSLPKSIKDGEQLFDFLRSNLGSYLDDKTSFAGYNSEEQKIWDSQNPLGSVMSFDAKFTGLHINLDDASVMTSSYYKGNGGGYWTFTTLYTNLRGDGEHPIAGTRQFGLTDNKDGSYTFYTRGTDRGYGIATLAGEETIFKSAELTWNTVMTKVFNTINANGGNALIPSSPISKRIPWEEVKKINK